MQPTRVLMIHGMGHMGNPPENWSKDLRQNLAVKLNVSASDCKTIFIYNDKNTEHKKAPVRKYDENTILQICTYAGTNGQTLQFYELTWSMLTEDIKEKVLGYDRKYASDRAKKNKDVKEKVINKGLSDAILYVANYRFALQYPIEQAICMVAYRFQEGMPCRFTEVRGQVDNLFIITHSLGSFMLYDTLKAKYARNAGNDGDPERTAVFDNIKKRTKTIYMLANQLPLLCLAFFSNAHRECEEPGTARVESNESQSAPQIHVIAISDPNDLLSYPLTDWQLGFLDLKVQVGPPTNVLVDLAGFSWTNILGWADSFSAHNGFYDDDRVVDVIACGIKKNQVAKCR